MGNGRHPAAAAILAQRSGSDRAPLSRISGGWITGRGWPFWVPVLGLWTLVGLFYATRPYVGAISMGRPAPELRVLIPHLADAYVWALFTPLIFGVSERFPFRRGRWLRSLLVHLAVAAVLANLSVVLNVLVEQAIHPRLSLGFGEHFARYFAITIHWNVQWYGIIVGVERALDYYRKYRDRELHASQLEAQLTRAQLEALKMQLQPHFLFNTLNVISELVHQDPAAADRMITRLGDLLRLSIDNSRTQQVPLRKEMEFLQAYLEIQKARFGDRLSVEIAIPPDTLEAPVPNLLLQPLVENAIRHGIAPRGEAGQLRISANRTDGMLLLQVRDNGVGLPNRGVGLREGVGLSNTRARLDQLYGGDCHFEIRNANGQGGGTVASVLLPFRPATRARAR